MLRRVLQIVLPPRMKKFFYGEGVCVWQSPWSVDEIQDRLRATLPAVSDLDWAYSGITGRMAGQAVHVGWKMKRASNSFAPIFHGTLTADLATGGTVLQGVFSANRFVQIFMAFWTGFILLFGLLSVWTIIFPLAAWGMLWLANGIMCLGDSMMPDMEDRLRHYLSQICSPDIPVAEIDKGGKGE